jgi:hypothetical protein
VYSTRPPGGARGGGFGGGLTGPVPRDLWILLGVVLGTFSLQFFSSTQWLPLLFRLTPAVWRSGFLWQLVTYPFVGTGAPGIWFLVSLLIVFLFGKDVYFQLGQRRFWKILIYAAGAAGLVAVVIGIVQSVFGGGLPAGFPFPIMQGQHMLLTILIAAFATLNRDATIYLFFVLPVQAKWFLLLEILFAFMGFLSTGDFAGFLGICTAVAFTFGYLTGWRRTGWSRELSLRAQQLWFRLRLTWLKRKRGLQVVKGGDEDKKQDPWVH